MSDQWFDGTVKLFCVVVLNQSLLRDVTCEDKKGLIFLS